MATARLSKVYFNKSWSNIDFATEEYIFDFLKILKAESHLPINQMLTILFNKEADTISCSRDDTNYSFFASRNRDVVSVIVKKLGEETIEFNIPRNKIDKVNPLPQL
jgi:hypothetical protein